MHGLSWLIGISYWSWTGGMTDHYSIRCKNPKEIEHNHNNRRCQLATQHTEKRMFQATCFEKFFSLTARKPFREPNLHWHHMKSAVVRLMSISQNSWAIAQLQKPWAKFLGKIADENFKILLSLHEDSWGTLSSRTVCIQRSTAEARDARHT